MLPIILWIHFSGLNTDYLKELIQQSSEIFSDKLQLHNLNTAELFDWNWIEHTAADFELMYYSKSTWFQQKGGACIELREITEKLQKKKITIWYISIHLITHNNTIPLSGQWSLKWTRRN